VRAARGRSCGLSQQRRCSQCAGTGVLLCESKKNAK
jgi:hypothetical protein